MDEYAVREMIAAVKAGHLSRRRFVQTLVPARSHRAVRHPDPDIGRHCGAPGSATASGALRRGGGGLLRVLWWQAPTLLNPHFAVGTKDQDGSRILAPSCRRVA